MASISGDRVNLDEIEAILSNHQSVRNAEVSVVKGENGINLLHAQIHLDKEFTPSNELKLDLAWHVGAESGNFSVFKDIDFTESRTDEDAGLEEEQQLRSGIVHISGHRIDTKEVEEALLTFDGVVYAKVMGVPDKRKGEILTAFVTLKEGMAAHNDLKTDLAWHARVEVSPVIVFRDIEFGDFQTQSREPGIEEAVTKPAKEPAQMIPDGMVIVDEVDTEGNVVHISSHKISTTEITNSLLSHPYVKDAAVLTVPHDTKGEVMKAFVKLKEGVQPSNDLKLDLAWHVMTELKPISVFKSIDLETTEPTPQPGMELPPVLEKYRDEVESYIPPMDRTLSEKVEVLLGNHPAVDEAIVIGVKDESGKEAMQAFVTLNDGFFPSEDLMEELAWSARTELGPEVVFRSLKFRRFFPVTPSRAKLEDLLRADAMEVPTMMSITIAD
jgi:acyl-coenzyme A synthetase/AMP-(fatty) acid ligase